MKLVRYILDDEGSPVACDDVMAWARWMQDTDCQVAEHSVGGARVSTVFMGVDHRFHDGGPPALWETMVFGGELAGEQWRYASREAAFRGHIEAVVQVLEAFLSDDQFADCSSSQEGR